VVHPPPRDFDACYAQHHLLVRRVLSARGVSTSDLDDAVQETFVIVHRLLPGFEERSSLETWLHAIAWRVAANYRRRAKRAAGERLDVNSDEGPPPGISPERLHASFSHVDDEHRDLLALHDIGGLSISSLADLTGNARATIRQRLERGRAALTRAFAARSPRPEQEPWYDAMAKRFEHPPDPLPPGVLRVLPDRQTCIAALDDLVLAVWRGPATDDGLQAAIGELVARAHVGPGGVRYLSIVERTSTAPSREGRAMMTWSVRKLGPKVTAAASTVEGSALMTLVAAVMNTSLFLARVPVNMHFFADLSAALSWLGRYGALEASVATDLIARMRQSLDPVDGGR
jgi:RNA polymerase sigma-70 factor (ECF subfamily)